MKIMVVDDEVDVELLFKQRFRKEIRRGNLEFVFVHSGEEALQYLKSQEAAAAVVLILSDINMGGMSGLELLRIVKEQFAHLKVFIITAYGDTKNYDIAQSYGVDDYFNKPLDFAELKAKVLGMSS
jgi:CheY-like chemotaxis protein